MTTEIYIVGGKRYTKEEWEAFQEERDPHRKERVWGTPSEFAQELIDQWKKTHRIEVPDSQSVPTETT